MQNILHTPKSLQNTIYTQRSSPDFFHLIINFDAKMESTLNNNTGSSGSGVGYSAARFDYLWGLIFLGYPSFLLAEHIL